MASTYTHTEWQTDLPKVQKALIKQYMSRIGRVGGKAAKAKQTPQQRSEAARKAARARWDKENDE